MVTTGLAYANGTDGVLYQVAESLIGENKRHISWYVRDPTVRVEVNKRLQKAPELDLGMTKAGQESFSYHWFESVSGVESDLRFTANGNILVYGCRYRSCDERGLVVLSRDNEPVFGVLSYFLNNSEYRRNGILLLYAAGSQVSQSAVEDIEDWLSEGPAPNAELIYVNTPR